ncbi:MAG: sugar transferase [Marmoricola sp.]
MAESIGVERARAGGAYDASPSSAVSVRAAHTKRALDLLLGGLVLVAVLPVVALVTVLVAVSSPGPVLHRQVRVGRDGRPLLIRKFRTMVLDADERREALLVHNEVVGGPLFKIRADPRITPVGRVLRRLSLDELPQLLNVLEGSMSLVGPRPALPAEVATYDARERRRLAVLPGLTGLWQVSGRSDLSWEESVALDLAYVEGACLRLDLVILARTVPAVLLGRGAY